MRSLVIDDEFVALSKLVVLLEPFGQCDAATNSRQALELFRKALNEKCPYHLVMIDINLPDLNGITLLRHLLEEERQYHTPHAKMLMVTAESTKSNVLGASTEGCDDFIVKPARRAVLLEKLRGLGLLTEAGQTAAEEPLDQRSQ
jgi:two-component system chemotaxis response regulator CheY